MFIGIALLLFGIPTLIWLIVAARRKGPAEKLTLTKLPTNKEIQS